VTFYHTCRKSVVVGKITSPDGKPACVSTRILTDSARKRIVSESYAEIFIMCLELIIFAKNNKESMIFWLELSKI
jgi:hypothetical protein